jgi:excisionase family DNA binding protein
MPNTPTTPPLLTIPQAAAALGVSPRSAWRLVRSGELPSLVVGRRLRRVALADVEVYVTLQREGTRRRRALEAKP